MIDADHLHRIAAELHELAEAGVAGLDPESLGQVALVARRVQELGDHIGVHALGALSETGHTEMTTGMSAAGWFAREARLPSGVGRSQVSIARALRRLPATDRAWLDGRISREHVRVLTDAANPRIRAHIVTLEDELIAIAGDRTFLRWRQKVSDVVSRLDQEGPDPDDAAHTTATWSRTGPFALLRATFAGADVELLEQIIEAETNRLFRVNASERDQTTDIPLHSRSQLRAQAVINLILYGPDTRTNPADTDLPTAGRDTEANDAAAEVDPETGKKIPKRFTNPVRVGVSLVLRPKDADLDAAGVPQLASPFAAKEWSLSNLEGQHLDLEHFESVLCDATASALLVDDGGTPFAQGHDARCASPAQRRIVIIRDGGCAMPGCDCPAAWVEIHHVIHHADGGKTLIVNLVALCRRHHGITHRKGWSMHASGDGWFYWVTPSGDSFWSQRYGRQRAGPTPHQLGIAA